MAYDVGAAFRRIEDELISSMIRNLDNHRAQESAEGFQWSQWQVEQLKALEDDMFPMILSFAVKKITKRNFHHILIRLTIK